jgi:hypothetical protein
MVGWRRNVGRYGMEEIDREMVEMVEKRKMLFSHCNEDTR